MASPHPESDPPGHAGSRFPHGHRVRVNAETLTFEKAEATGREILTRAGLTPPENYTLRLKAAGEPPRKVELDERIDLSRPGVERFKALPRDQTEGEAPLALRRHFALSPQDAAFLAACGRPYETLLDGGSQWVLIHGFPTHPGYDNQAVSIAVRLETGYPHTALDMVWVRPPLARRDGGHIPQTQLSEPIDGRMWQRWSRHRTQANPWRPGEDSLETHVYLVEDWFQREFGR